MKKIICPECKTENEEQFRFCKNCGTALTYEAGEPKSDFKTPEEFEPKSAQHVGLGAQIPELIDGTEKREMMAFIGKDAHKFFGKFLKMEYSGSKISWCWPVFFLNLVFGFFGSALWFLYRKMFKPAIALIVAAVLIMGVETALTFDQSVEMSKGFIVNIEEFFLNGGSDVANPELFFGEEGGEAALSEPTGVLAIISDTLNTIETLLGGVFMAMFALNVYKKHATAKIKEQREKHGESPYYLYTLSLKGGTSGGMLAFGIVLFVVLSNVFTAIPAVVAFLMK